MSEIINIVNIEISDMCIETYPCKHRVKVYFDDNSYLVDYWFAPKIKEVLIKLKQFVPEHFN